MLELEVCSAGNFLAFVWLQSLEHKPHRYSIIFFINSCLTFWQLLVSLKYDNQLKQAPCSHASEKLLQIKEKSKKNLNAKPHFPIHFDGIFTIESECVLICIVNLKNLKNINYELWYRCKILKHKKCPKTLFRRFYFSILLNVYISIVSVWFVLNLICECATWKNGIFWKPNCKRYATNWICLLSVLFWTMFVFFNWVWSYSGARKKLETAANNEFSILL